MLCRLIDSTGLVVLNKASSSAMRTHFLPDFTLAFSDLYNFVKFRLFCCGNLETPSFSHLYLISNNYFNYRVSEHAVKHILDCLMII